MNNIFISISKDNSERSVNFYNKEIQFSELPNVTSSQHYSNISFKDGYRKGVNFQGVSVLIFDIDEGFNVEEVKKKLEAYKALIVTTKSHRASVKNGKEITPCDRYRLFLPIEKPITDADRYKTIMIALIEEFQADKACKDLARFYYCNPKQEIHALEGDKYWDVSQYKAVTKPKKAKTSSKSTKITKSTTLIDEDGNEMTASDFYEAFEDGEGAMIHCPLFRESHKNNDANPSCSMKKNGNYLNLKCFGCDGKASINFGKSKTKNTSKNEVVYTVPDFNKNEAINEVVQGLDNMEAIVAELVRLLPALEKEEKNDD